MLVTDFTMIRAAMDGSLPIKWSSFALRAFANALEKVVRRTFAVAFARAR